MKTSGISRDEAIANPNETLQVLEFQSNYSKEEAKKSKSFLTIPNAPNPLPEEKPITLSELVSKEDPLILYKGLEKIGEGAAGEVFVATHTRLNKKVTVLRKRERSVIFTDVG